MKARQTRRKRKLQRGGNNNNKWTNKTSQFQQALEKLRNAGKLFGNTKKSMSKSKSKSKSNKD
jgi:hypothetical protein